MSGVVVVAAVTVVVVVVAAGGRGVAQAAVTPVSRWDVWNSNKENKSPQEELNRVETRILAVCLVTD